MGVSVFAYKLKCIPLPPSFTSFLPSFLPSSLPLLSLFFPSFLLLFFVFFLEEKIVDDGQWIERDYSPWTLRLHPSTAFWTLLLRSDFIPIPKKGNAKECSSYCTIALTLSAFAQLHSVLQGQICLLFQVFPEFQLLHSSTLQWKGHLSWVLVLEGLVGLHRTVQL